jgi:hypothetical protein
MLITNLTNRFTVTNEAINNMTTWTEIIIPALQRDMTSDNDTEEEGEVLLNRTSFIARLNEFRNQIVSEENRENNVFEVGGKIDGHVCFFTLSTFHHLPMGSER